MPNIALSRELKALVFDTFGTVVDWRSSCIEELSSFGEQTGIAADWAAFADAWRAGYVPGMDRVRNGERPFVNIDIIHRERFDELLSEFRITGITEAEKQHLTLIWHRLQPWPDSVSGLTRLKQHYIISTFSNGSVLCLVDMAKRAGLGWDCIYSADLCKHFKPDPEIYLGVIDMLSLQPAEIMLVAAHNGDLRHGRSHGLHTAYINRPTEYGPYQKKDLHAEEDWDIVCDSLTALADALDA